jgi:hypothetical protein
VYSWFGDIGLVFQRYKILWYSNKSFLQKYHHDLTLRLNFVLHVKYVSLFW